METSNITTTELVSPEILENLVINGDLSKLNTKQKVEYYSKYCHSLGLNPLTQPFKILKLQGKETLYCDRSGTAQLNKVHNVSHTILKTESINGVYMVVVKASTGNRFTTSTGVVTIENLKGDALCNALMKAETKAKRRATLDLLGLGTLDESEVETIPNAQVMQLSIMSKEDAINLLIASTTKEELRANWELIGTDNRSDADIIEVCKKVGGTWK